MDLRKLIRERGLRHGWIAKQLGITETAFSRIVNGDSSLPDDKIKPLAAILRVPQADLRAAMNGGIL